MRWRRSSLYANKIGWTGMLAIGALEEAAVFSSCCSFLFFFVAPASFPNTLRFLRPVPGYFSPQPPLCKRIHEEKQALQDKLILADTASRDSITMLESQIRTLRQSSSLETTRLKDELRSKADQLEQLRQQLVSKESWWKEQLKVSRAELEHAKKEGAERASFLQASLSLTL